MGYAAEHAWGTYGRHRYVWPSNKPPSDLTMLGLLLQMPISQLGTCSPSCCVTAPKNFEPLCTTKQMQSGSSGHNVHTLAGSTATWSDWAERQQLCSHAAMNANRFSGMLANQTSWTAGQLEHLLCTVASLDGLPLSMRAAPDGGCSNPDGRCGRCRNCRPENT